MYSVCALTKFQGKIVFIDDKYLRLRSMDNSEAILQTIFHLEMVNVFFGGHAVGHDWSEYLFYS